MGNKQLSIKLSLTVLPMVKCLWMCLHASEVSLQSVRTC